MAQIRAALDRVAKALRLSRLQLAKARRRAKKFRERTEHNHEEQLAAQRAADAPQGRFASREAAEAFERKARRCSQRAIKSQNKAEFWRGRIRKLLQRIHRLEAKEEKLEAELAEWIKTHGPRVVGNHVEGGTPHARWMLACLTSVRNCANRGRRNFYSMAGAWDIDHELVGGPEYGHRSDCSSTVTGWAKAAGLPDPNGADWGGGFTGTLVGEHDGWKQVSRGEMIRKGWGYVVYGPGSGHHTEAYTPSPDNDQRTSGHGSGPVNFAVIDMFGAGEYQRYYIYDPS